MNERKHKQLSRTQSAARSKVRGGAKSRQWPAALALVVMVALCYLPALSGGYVMDDEAYVAKNLTLRSTDGLRQMWFEPRSLPQYYPFLHTILWLEYHLWGPNPLGYHAVIVLLQALNAVLAWRILLRLQVPGAWFTAAIFAVHPVCVESVAWVTKLMNLQSMLLALASMWCYLQFEPAGPHEDSKSRRDRRWWSYGMSLILFLFALLSKTVVAPLPAVLLVIYWWKRGRIVWSNVWPLIPFFVVGATLGLMTVWLEQYQAGATGADFALTFAQRCLIAGRAVWFYVGKFVWPHPLMFYYSRWTVDPQAWWQWLFPAGVAAVFISLWLLRNRIGRGPLAAALIYVGVLFPALGFFNVYAFRFSFVADHYQYHAVLALAALAGAGAQAAVARVGVERRAIVYTSAAAIVVLCGTLTFGQARLYRDQETLYRDTIAKNPDSWVAYTNLAAHLAHAGRSTDAILLFRKAIELNPGDVRSHFNLAGVLVESVDYVVADSQPIQEAIQQLRETLRLAPEHVEARLHLANLLVQLGRTEEAKVYFEEAAKLDRPRALYGMGVALAAAGKWDEAERDLQESLRQDPTNIEAHQALGNVLASSGKLEAAVEHFREAASLRPDYFQAWHNLGATLVNLGKPDEAIPYIERALQIRPDDPGAKKNLQEALEKRMREK